MSTNDTDIELLKEDPPPINRSKPGQYADVVQQIAEGFDADTWVRISKTFAKSKDARSAIESMKGSAKAIGKRLEGTVRTVEKDGVKAPRVWVKVTDPEPQPAVESGDEQRALASAS